MFERLLVGVMCLGKLPNRKHNSLSSSSSFLIFASFRNDLSHSQSPRPDKTWRYQLPSRQAPLSRGKSSPASKMRAGQADLALGVKDRLGRSSNSPEFTSHPQGQARIELTDALGLTRSRFIEDRAPAALLHQIKAPLKKIEASSIWLDRFQGSQLGAQSG